MSCLRRAEELMQGERQADYGDPVDTAERVAHAWSAVLGHHVSPEQYALMMAVLKIVRESGRPKQDNLDDACAYLRIAELALARKSVDRKSE